MPSINSVEAFRQAVEQFQSQAIRLFATFSEAYRVLSQARDLDSHLAPLAPRENQYLERRYRERTDWDVIEQIPEKRLPDLGYISAKRVKQEANERQVVSEFLTNLADRVDAEGADKALKATEEAVAARMDSLLRQFNSTFQFSLLGTMFSPDADQLRREAARLGPKDEGDLVQMQETQDVAQRNLANYLSADHLDIYVATSMRTDADFISVNRFALALFDHQNVKPYRLRYFNPTQSWIEDRVAKGLVEALMLRRADFTIYMAQKDDTFGKDSEASVALGQGKPVIVYVPRLYVPEANVNTEEAFRLDRAQLEDLVRHEARTPEDRDFDATVDNDGLLGRLIRMRLEQATGAVLAKAAREHWADFDLYGESESERFAEEHRAAYREWLDKVIAGEILAPAEEFRDELVKLFVSSAVRFERRARVFREIHPLALQVILSSGVLNGILVVRSVERCAQVLSGLIKNDLATRFIHDENNYRLVEETTGSTIRVISKHHLIQHAFDAFYRSEDQDQ